MSILKNRDEIPGYLEDYPLRSQTAATLLQVPSEVRSLSRTPSACSAVGDDSPICARETSRIGKDHIVTGQKNALTVGLRKIIQILCIFRFGLVGTAVIFTYEGIYGVPTKGLNRRLAFAIAAAVIGSSFQHGYSIGVVNAPQKLIEEWIRNVLQGRSETGTIVEQREVTMIFSIFVSIFCVGGMLGGCATGFIADKFGRKGGLILNTILVMLSCILQGSAKAASSYELLIAGRFLIGVNTGLNTGLAPLYVAEISPAHLRGATGTAYQLVVTISIVISQFLGSELILGTENGWPVLMIVSIFPCIFQLVTLPFCPESPKYLLISQDDEIAAERALVWLRETMQVYDELEDMKSESENMRVLSKVTLKEMVVNPMLRMPLVTAVIIMIGQQFSGINAVMFYSTKIFKMAGLDNEGAQYATLATGLANVAMTVVSLVFVERAGRKTLLLIGFQGMFFITILFVICLSLADKSTVISYFSISLIMLFVIFFAVGPGSIPWFLVTELFNQSARPVATSVAVAVNWTANFIVGLAFLPLQELLKAYVFIIFAILLAMFSVYIKYRVPETKNKTVDEILAVFRQRSYI